MWCPFFVYSLNKFLLLALRFRAIMAFSESLEIYSRGGLYEEI